MSTSIQQIAEAFSSHRFTETFPHFDPDIRWVAVGESTLEGRDAVIRACEDSAAEMADVSTEFTRFVSVAGPAAVAVDAIGRYVDSTGSTSVVSSCDIYEFDGDALTSITTYAVELPSD